MKSFNIIGKTIKYLCLYPVALVALTGISEINSPKIETVSQLETEISKLRTELKIKDEDKIVVFAEGLRDTIMYKNRQFTIQQLTTANTNDLKSSSACKLGDGLYTIYLNKYGQKMNVLKHEMYHIADGHCDIKVPEIPYIPSEFLRNPLYFFYVEPQAVIYEATGLKL